MKGWVWPYRFLGLAPQEVAEAVCPLYLRLLLAGQEAALSFTLHSALPSGGYWFRTDVFEAIDTNEVVSIYTDRFEIKR